MLWTNPNPYTNFEAQTLTLDLNSYDYILIKSMPSTGDNSNYGYSMIPVNNVQNLMTSLSNASGVSVGRTVIASTTGVNIGAGWNFTSPGWSAGYAIPVAIYGFKIGINL